MNNKMTVLLLAAMWGILDLHASSFQPAYSRRAVQKPEWEGSYAGYRRLPNHRAFLPAKKKQVSFFDSSQDPNLEKTRVPKLVSKIAEVPKWDKMGSYASYDTMVDGLLALGLTVETIQSQYRAWQEEVDAEKTRLGAFTLSDERQLDYIDYLIRELHYLSQVLSFERDFHNYSGLEAIVGEEEQDKALDLFLTLLEEIPMYIDQLQAYYDEQLHRILEDRVQLQTQLMQQERQRIEAERAAGEAALGIDLMSILDTPFDDDALYL